MRNSCVFHELAGCCGLSLMILSRSPVQSAKSFSLCAICYHSGPNAEEEKGLCPPESVRGECKAEQEVPTGGIELRRGELTFPGCVHVHICVFLQTCCGFAVHRARLAVLGARSRAGRPLGSVQRVLRGLPCPGALRGAPSSGPEVTSEMPGGNIY